MKSITQEKLDKRIELHGIWKQSIEGGIKLDLSYYDLSGLSFEGANLRGVDFEGATLEGANLENAYLRYANLENAYLRGANLEGANLRGANLEGANLEGANLKGVFLWNTIGDGTYIKNIHIPNEYIISYPHNRIQIGCKNHSIEDWTNFNDERIVEMDGKKALKFWREYKEYILDTIKNNPARNTCY